MFITGYAVVDVETTGLFPRKHDRIAEVGIVLVDRDGEVVDEWCTLVNPNRDLGPQDIHGIRACDVRQAPTFADVAGDLATRLTGRVIVAHNLSFDAMFLASEYLRLGVHVPISRDLGLCTMHLSGKYLTSPARTLSACCKAAEVVHTDAHSALSDARACAGLLSRFIRTTPRPEPWFELLERAGRMDWPALPRGCGRTFQRGSVDERATTFLARLIDRLPRVPDADDYLALLDRALLDRYLSASEQDALLDLAHQLGLSLADAMELHRMYLAALAEAAWQDSVVTDDERRDLLNVANLLGLTGHDVDAALKEVQGADGMRSLGRFRLTPGDLVAFTGQMNGSREEWEARATDAGLRVANVTRRTRLLVAADPDSLSGKAKKAREYGMPIVTEEAFESLLDQLERRQR